MTFNEYCEDVLDLHIGLLSEEDRIEAYKSYQAYKGGRPRSTLSAGAMGARADAKALGGKALKGSKKQKEWAEKIRAEKIREMTEDQARVACDPNGILSHSKFWIENRNKSGREIGEFVQEQKALLAEARELKAAGKESEYAVVASIYNNLTTEWGF